MKTILGLGYALAFGAILCLPCIAQTRGSAAAGDKFVISANAGGINLTQGDVTVTRASGIGGAIVKGDRIAVGDTISTGANGRVEVLLNPGSYMRVGSNSTFKFQNTSLDDLRIVMLRGNAVFEVFATDKFRVNIITPNEQLAMIESGVYRVDLDAAGTGSLGVKEGKAVVGLKNSTIVKGGKTAKFGSQTVNIAKTEKRKGDELGDWSKSRARDLAKMTASLKNANLNNALQSSFMGGAWNLYSSFGVWINDPWSGFSCFLPFGRWNSPYGFGYDNWLYRYRPIYLPPPIQTAPAVSDRRLITEEPPFVAIERQQRIRDEARRPTRDDNGDPIRNDDGRINSGRDTRLPGDSRSIGLPTPPSLDLPASPIERGGSRRTPPRPIIDP